MHVHRCTCDDPKAKLCMTHKLYRLSMSEEIILNIRINLLRVRYLLARLVMGDHWYNIKFECSHCSAPFSPTRPKPPEDPAPHRSHM